MNNNNWYFGLLSRLVTVYNIKSRKLVKNMKLFSHFHKKSYIPNRKDLRLE